MKIDRRDFLKIGGLGALGIAAKPVIDVVSKRGLAEASSKGASSKGVIGAGKRLAMAIDLKKCKENCTSCIDVCHKIHNVPDFGNPKDEIKWLWREPYEKAFPEQ